MKVKPAKETGNVVVQLGPRDDSLVREALSPFALKSILVPIDFSDCSKKALQYAIPFAKQFSASITLLHVIQTNFVGGEFGSIDFSLLESELRESRTKQMSALVKDDIGGTVPTTTLIKSGQPLAEIIAAARSLDIDLIIIATHGHTGLKHVLMGSTTESVVRYAPCPVLTVREHEHEFIKLNHVV